MSSNQSPQDGPSAVEHLKHTIKQPSTAFTAENTLQKQVWSTEVSERELKEALALAHVKLEVAMKNQVKVLKKEVQKLEDRIEDGLLVQQHAEWEDLKGDICR